MVLRIGYTAYLEQKIKARRDNELENIKLENLFFQTQKAIEVSLIEKIGELARSEKEDEYNRKKEEEDILYSIKTEQAELKKKETNASYNLKVTKIEDEYNKELVLQVNKNQAFIDKEILSNKEILNQISEAHLAIVKAQVQKWLNGELKK